MWQKNTWVKLTHLKVLKNAMTSLWSFMYTYQAQLSTHFSDVYSFFKECLLKNKTIIISTRFYCIKILLL